MCVIDKLNCQKVHRNIVNCRYSMKKGRSLFDKYYNTMSIKRVTSYSPSGFVV